ncbi:carbon-nitrogen hydrolase family protein [Marinomonas fungiae]|uniref:carbon-nitrogen hydrolase family protein n=1 Tax=Marinomonas fungiae TaxID=1137284 RepID=UPI003A919EED
MNNEKITFSLVQYPSVKGDIQKNLINHLENIKLSADYGADVVIFPELSLTGYELEIASQLAIDDTSSIISELSQAAIDNHVVIVSGAPLISGSDKPYIGAFISYPSGKTDFYRKQYLHAGEDNFVSAGSENYCFEIKGKKLFLGICADFTCSQHWLDANSAQVDIYLSSVLISQNGFEHDSKILKQKAIEHNLNIVMTNYIGETGGWFSNGNSRVWDSNGNVCISANDADPCLVLCAISNNNISGRIINITKNFTR